MILEKGLTAFLDAMLGKNRSAGTLRAYKTDILQFTRLLYFAIAGVHVILSGPLLPPA